MAEKYMWKSTDIHPQLTLAAESLQWKVTLFCKVKEDHGKQQPRVHSELWWPAVQKSAVHIIIINIRSRLLSHKQSTGRHAAVTLTLRYTRTAGIGYNIRVRRNTKHR